MGSCPDTDIDSELSSSHNETKTKRSLIFTEDLWYLSKVDCTSVLIWLAADYSTSVFAHWQSKWLLSLQSGDICLSYVSTTHAHLSSKTITKLHVKYDVRLDNYTMYRDFKVTLRFGTKYQCQKRKPFKRHLSLSWFQENNKDCAC